MLSATRFHIDTALPQKRPHAVPISSPLPHAATISSPRPYSPSPLLTPALTTLSYSLLLSRHMRAASTFAGLSSFGSASMLITLMRIFSTLWIGLHRSDAFS